MLPEVKKCPKSTERLADNEHLECLRVNAPSTAQLYTIHYTSLNASVALIYVRTYVRNVQMLCL